MTRTQRTAIDLFCGAGGLSEGFRQAGYSVLAGHDINEVAGLTYAATHPGSKFLLGSISDLSIRDLCGVTGVKPGELDVLLGGPPCQAYSVYNHQRGMHDARSGLFWEYLRIVKGLMPKWVVIENVTGITSIDGGEVVRTIKRELGALGYEVDLRILRAEDYGIPQERRRVVFIGNRVGAPVRFPAVTHGAPDNGLIPLTTIWDAIGDLPQIGNGGAGDRTYRHHPMSDFQRYARQDAGRFAKKP
jgi:Site-specific DNA methylase